MHNRLMGRSVIGRLNHRVRVWDKILIANVLWWMLTRRQNTSRLLLAFWFFFVKGDCIYPHNDRKVHHWCQWASFVFTLLDSLLKGFVLLSISVFSPFFSREDVWKSVNLVVNVWNSNSRNLFSWDKFYNMRVPTTF